jgi:hypothetical protein
MKVRTPGKDAKKYLKKKQQQARAKLELQARQEQLSRQIAEATELVSAQYSRKLLKGVKWGDFFRAKNGDLVIDGVKFSFRVGYFFTIYACAIICNKKYVVLRKVPTKSMDTYKLAVIDEFRKTDKLLYNTFEKDTSLSGLWYSHKSTAPASYSGQSEGSFVLERSKFDLLRRD